MYLFHEIKKQGALPDDVNAFIEQSLAHLHCDELMDTLRDIREKRLYGDLDVYDYNHVQVMRIKNIEKGVIQKVTVIRSSDVHKITLPLVVLFMESKRNVGVSFRNPKETDKCEK